MKFDTNTPLAQRLFTYVQPIFGFLSVVHADPNKSEGLMRSAMGTIG